MLARMRSCRTALILALAALSLSACKPAEEAKKEDKPKEKDAPELKAPDPAPDTNAKPDLDLSGPMPPEAMTAIFAVDGALIPLACFDPSGKKILGGKACLDLVPADAEVLLKAETGMQLDKLGARKNALCEVADKPGSFSTAATEKGDRFEVALYPKSLTPGLLLMAPETKKDKALELTEEEKTALIAAIKANGGKTEGGPLRIAQRAAADIDGDGKDEVFFSTIVDDEKDSERFVFSGLFMANGGALDAMVLVDRSKGADIIVLRSAVDLDGDKIRELHIGLTFQEGGSGDRIAIKNDKGFSFAADWSCGA